MLVDLLIHSIKQLITCASPHRPKRGAAMRDVGLIEAAAVAVHQGKIVAVGSSVELCKQYTATESIDASNRVVCPGFVDPHTHVVYAGNRLNEFELRIQGASYLEIMAAGGGIASTTRATRAASLAQLVAESQVRFGPEMLQLGTTTAESKSGYGLDTASELKQLQAMQILSECQPVELIPTFLAAHAIPTEFQGRSTEYVTLVIEEMIPAAAHWHATSPFALKSPSPFAPRHGSAERSTECSRRSLAERPPPATLHPPLFIDVFCEKNAFDLAQSQKILAAGRAAGMRVKAHLDEFTDLGGVPMALALDAISVDHLDVTNLENIRQIAQSDTVAVVIPTVNFNLGSTHFANARAMIDAGCIVALTTDINPGSAPCPSLPLTMAIACRYQKLLPAEALNASTINAAHAIGLGEQVGSIEVGKQADLLLLDTDDYRQLAYQFGGNLVQQVFKRGVRVG